MDLDSIAENIRNKKEFEVFLKELKLDFETNKENWENFTLAKFLEGISAYTEDLEGYYKNMKIPFDRENPTWKVFADILLGAKIYE
ncbi:hypothetical protein WIW50_07775 [Flavobacteriaceae bacterium 3-367]